MLFDLIALGVLVLSLIVIAAVVIRKFPTLAAVDPVATAGSAAQRKQSLMEERLRRKVTGALSRISSVSTPIASNTGRLWTAAHKKLVDLEHEYKVRSLPVFLTRRQRRKMDGEIAVMLKQAQSFIDEKEYVAAEEKALQAVRFEPRSVPAFELLGQLYTLTKEFGHAKEVYQYLIKLSGDADAIYQHLASTAVVEGASSDLTEETVQPVDLNRTVATYYLALAQIQLDLQDPDKAFTSIQEASRLEPNNPKVLDQYVEMSITLGRKQFAEDAVARIEGVNPENTKITEWRQRIAELPDALVV